jgi:HPt (histidine-containing phosphotransfer) domain-containing protein
MSQTAMDAAAFSEMKELMGDAFKDIIAMCVQSLPEQLAEIEMAIKNQDADTLFHIAHKMKSSCGSIGAFGLAEKAEVIELIGRRGSTQDSTDAFAELQSSLAEVLTLLKEEMN